MQIKINKGMSIFLLVVMVLVGVLVPGGEDRAYADVSNPDAKITMFYVIVPNQGNAYGTIDEANKTIVVDVPFGTDVTNLDSRVYMTGVDFLNEYEHHFRSTKAKEAEWGDLFEGIDVERITQKFIDENDDHINAYYRRAFNESYIRTNGDIDVFLKSFPDLLEYNEKPIRVGRKDFTSPVNFWVYTGVPSDSPMMYKVTVRVSESKSQEKSITAFGFAGMNVNTQVATTIDEANKVITLKVPEGTDVKALVPTFTITGTSMMTDVKSNIMFRTNASQPIGIFVIPVTIPVKQVSGKTAQDFTNPVQYDVIAADLSRSTYMVTVMIGEGAKKITSFKFADLNPVVTGVVDEEQHLINLEVPDGTDIKSLVPTFTSAGGSVHVGNEPQVSDTSSQDFTNPVSYTVEASDNSTVDYSVIVSIAKAQEKSITAFSFEGFNPGVTGAVDEENKMIALTVPYGTNVKELIPIFTITGASVTAVELSSQRIVTPVSSGKTALDFTYPVIYGVLAADQSVTNYTVTVKVAENPAKAITAFTFAGLNPVVSGMVDEENHRIVLTVPNGTNIKVLVPTFATTGASVKVANKSQVSGTTSQDFTNPITYAVVAADDSSVNYTVTVKVAAPGVLVGDKTAQLPPKDDSVVVNISDISGHWAEMTIKQAVKQGIVKGYEDGSFKPDAIITRAEFVTMLISARKPALSNTPLSFTDLQEIPAWSKQAITQAVEAGILSGYPDGSFRPQAKITRMEMAMMITKASGKKIATDVNTGFSDDNEIAQWAKGAVLTAKQLGIVNGRGDNQFVPNGIATRAEAVTLIINLLQVK
ncbi:S-layer homology domain-containing protein [Paenibacillus sp. Soil750]|uniref:S-layer homology domain-containing protein n=1 Tax=Paenibacillus sp. Soil750 TaxID=1736398 RepID=UPI00070141F5|nr:S-layer homology domain-containing protein [Paenibacillus sp. Soil750]KRE55880.1 hypothetical protein ASL11_34650 [Paenibacillus sp. Soil750]